ncbi:MAG: glycosyltransferase, partial [Candidatus Woesebacteria bacterium]|nr:glycosyltransferase [Candidatus Woesebacteria bacterium]
MNLNAFRSWKDELAKINQIDGLLVPGQEKALLVIASKLAPQSTIVEIGSFKGKSTACFALGSPTSTKIYAIDTFAGNSKDFSEGVQFMGHNFLEEFTKNIKGLGISKKVFPTIGFSSKIGEGWKKPIDLLFIDGSHIYEDIKKDFELFFPWVKDGGFVLLHDVDKEFPGVLRVWNRLAENKLECHSNVSSLFFGIKKGSKITRKSAVNVINKTTEEINTHKVHVVIPVFNRISFTKKCFSSLAKQTYKNFEVILIDDGSTDGTSTYISKEYPKCKIIKGKGRWWWTRSMHEGVKEALKTADDEDFILSMNNDCYFKKDYLENIVEASSENQRAITGSIIIEAEHPTKVKDAGVLINWENAIICDVTSRFSSNLKFYSDKGLIKDLDTLPGKGTLIPKEVFDKIGNFNYLMLPHYIGDYEFFCRAKRKNLKLIVSSKARLYNFAR